MKLPVPDWKLFVADDRKLPPLRSIGEDGSKSPSKPNDSIKSNAADCPSKTGIYKTVCCKHNTKQKIFMKYCLAVL